MHVTHNGTEAKPLNPPVPLISVVLPVFNNQRYLREAIRSVLTQSHSDFELLLVDDGSTDASPAMLAEAARRDPRVRVFQRPHQGVVAALNFGIEQARGRYIARMDADDISLPSRFQRQADFLENSPDHVLVGSRVLLIDCDGDPICEFALETEHDQIDHAHMALRWPLVHPSVMMRADVVRSVGGYRRQHETLEDLDLFLRLAEVGRLANLPQVLLHYRQHFQSMCYCLSPQQNRVRVAVFADAYARRGLPADRPPEAYAAPKRSVAGHYRRWGWDAIRSGHLRTARKYALKSFRRRPFDLESWRLLACAARGR